MLPLDTNTMNLHKTPGRLDYEWANIGIQSSVAVVAFCENPLMTASIFAVKYAVT